MLFGFIGFIYKCLRWASPIKACQKVINWSYLSIRDLSWCITNVRINIYLWWHFYQAKDLNHITNILNGSWVATKGPILICLLDYVCYKLNILCIIYNNLRFHSKKISLKILITYGSLTLDMYLAIQVFACFFFFLSSNILVKLKI